MSTLLQIHHLSLTQGTKPLFSDISFTLQRGDQVALVGHNGCGKSSMLRLIAGFLEADAGEVRKQRGLSIAFVEQFVPETLLNATLEHSVALALPEELRQVERYRVHQQLELLGFLPSQWTQTLGSLSGGQQNLALLARAAIQQPELLLMDEPGNHMDVTAMQALRRYLQQQRNLSYLLISHDRDLLDATCNKTLFIRDQQLFHFELSYSAARQALLEQVEQAKQQRQQQQKEIDRIRQSAKRLATWGKTFDNEDLARKAKTMARRADKLDATKTDVLKDSGLSLQLSSEALRSRTVLTLEGLQVFVPETDTRLLSCEFLSMKPGDRVALLGPNGCGKSTTLKRLLQAQQQADQSIRFNPNVDLVYYDQELELFQEAVSRIDWLRKYSTEGDENIKKILISSGVPYQSFGQMVTELSGGERARMMFMLMRLRQPNLLVLDEPTNHIDLEGREQLEQQLIDSGASLLVTSHDRRFLERVATRFWCIQQGHLLELNELSEFYDTLEPYADRQSGESVLNVGASHADIEELRQQDLLDEIERLETLLSNDRRQKAKFQKPQKQQQWQQALDACWAQLE